MIKLEILMLDHSLKFGTALMMPAISNPKSDHHREGFLEDVSLLQDSVPLSTEAPDKIAGDEANCFCAWLGGASLECSY